MKEAASSGRSSYQERRDAGLTMSGDVLGTLRYMSPEQALARHGLVDHRTDIYSLGATLYELLLGRPAVVGEDKQEILRQLAFEEPTAPHRLDARLPRDLETVVLKCLDKSPDFRYASAQDLADDLKRWLAHKPLQAKPPTLRTRAAKWVRRNRPVVATAMIIAATLLAGTGVSIWQAVEATKARDLAAERLKHAEAESARAGVAEKRATTEAAIAKAVNAFVQQDLLGQVTSLPEPAYDHLGVPNLTVRETLDRAAARIGSRFRDQPLVEAAIRRTIGEAYNDLAENRLAVPHLERAVALHRAELGSANQETLRSMRSLAVAYQWVARIQEAIALQEQVLAGFKTQLGPSHPETLGSLGNLAGSYSFAGQWDTALQLKKDLLEERRAVLGPTHPETVGTVHSLAMTYRDMDRIAESMALHAEALQGFYAMTGPERGGAIWCMVSYAYVCERANRLKQGEDLLREALRRCRARPDQRSRISRAVVLGWLARNLLLQEQFVDGERLAREAIEVFEHESPNDRRLPFWRSVLGGTLLGQQRYEEAELLLLQGYEGLKRRELDMPADQRFRLIEAGERVVRLYEVIQQLEKAIMWREKLGMKGVPN